jgi:hypothetical protein
MVNEMLGSAFNTGPLGRKYFHLSLKIADCPHEVNGQPVIQNRFLDSTELFNDRFTMRLSIAFGGFPRHETDKCRLCYCRILS